MSRIYISLDIETTGLDNETDAILEIGAVRFTGSEIIDTFETLINPQRHIPYHIQQLTGIHPNDVQNAPTIESVLPDLQDFVGDAPVIGHNIQFDLGFLNQHGLFLNHIGIDTFELASILLPYAKRYSLTALFNYLNLQVSHKGDAHRALYDAQVTYELFKGLLARARDLAPNIIEEIVRLGRNSKIDWPLLLLFEDLWNDHQDDLLTEPTVLFRPPEHDRYTGSLKPNDSLEPLDIISLAKTLEPAGLFSQQFDKFEYRPQQVDMLAHVSTAFNEGKHLIVEAGTGTGKSVAYLLPSIHWAVQNNERVVISTNTINLQDQLIEKDIPALQALLPLTFKAVTLKGRSNYVCPRRVAMYMAKGQHNATELRLLCKLLVWLPQTKTGDREELFMPERGEQILWWQVASDGHICTARTCTAETCFYAYARRNAESAHIIVVNHALLMADVAVDGRVIPDYQYLIIDESHHLEDSITDQLSVVVDERLVDQLLRELSQPGRRRNQYYGLFEELSQNCLNAIPRKAGDLLVKLLDKGHSLVERTKKYSSRLFQANNSFALDFGRGGQYNQKIRLVDDTRNKPSWSNVELAWDNLGSSVADLLKILSQLNTLLLELENHNIPYWEELVTRLGLYRSQLDKVHNNLRGIISTPNEEYIYWLEQNVRTQQTAFHQAPLHVGNLFHEHVLKPNEVVILTSATLQTNNSFEYFQERLHLWDANKAAVGSPFDYHHNTLLYIPVDVPLPHTHNYTQAVSRSIIQLATEIEGRTLVLFTSYSHLKQIADGIRSPLAEQEIAVYQQGTGTSRRQLIDNFKQADKAVLLGTRSFWEGVDIPGNDLSCVVITKIPFAVPSDPIIASRSQTFKNAFAQYSIPLAILTFRQGFGRLNRTKTDRGVVVILDRRVVEKSYGQVFIDSLPEVTEQRGLLANLPSMAAQWINQG